MEVKTWKPAPGCRSCERAAQLFTDHARMRMEAHGKALSEIRKKNAEIERLSSIESAARNLIEYQTTGAPEHLEWEEKFEALEAALRGEGGE